MRRTKAVAVLSETNVPNARPPVTAPTQRPIRTPRTSLDINSRLSSDETLEIADTGTFDTLTDNLWRSVLSLVRT
ncbi:hypothetical protein TUM20984_35250 [Mycobacterium antarcticum]|nr:hypothetical protein TUM20984_35250 [Mycolicibacterium sp. TUM20984]